MPEFWSLVTSLEVMARRWVGPLRQHNEGRPCLASKYATELRDLHRHCVSDPKFTVDVLGYSYSNNSLTCYPCQPPPSQTYEAHGSPDAMRRPHDAASNVAPDMVVGSAPEQDGSAVGIMQYPARDSESGDELSAISHMLMDQRFLEMDRIISFDDTIFTSRTSAVNPQPLGVDDWARGPYTGM